MEEEEAGTDEFARLVDADPLLRSQRWIDLMHAVAEGRVHPLIAARVVCKATGDPIPELD